MKIFKSLDNRIFDELDFVIGENTPYGVTYVRYNCEYGYTHKVAILHKKSGKHILQSYDADNAESTNVGLSYKELRLFMKKFRKLRRKWKKPISTHSPSGSGKER